MAKSRYKLKPCPVCEGTEINSWYYVATDRYAVHCANHQVCGARGTFGRRSRSAAHREWNAMPRGEALRKVQEADRLVQKEAKRVESKLKKTARALRPESYREQDACKNCQKRTKKGGCMKLAPLRPPLESYGDYWYKVYSAWADTLAPVAAHGICDDHMRNKVKKNCPGKFPESEHCGSHKDCQECENFWR